MRQRKSRFARGGSRSDPVRRLVEQAADVIFRVRLDPHPRLEYINRAVAALSGYPLDEWYGNGALLQQVLHPDDRRKLKTMLSRGRLPSQPVLLRWFCRDGTPVTTEVRARPVHARDGTLVAIEGIARRVGSTARAAAATRGRDRHATALFDHAPIAMAHVAVDGRFLMVNRRLCDLTGYSPDEMLGKRLLDITHPDDLARDLALLGRVASAEILAYTMEKRFVCKDGTPVWTRVQANFAGGTGAMPFEGVLVVEPITGPGQSVAPGRIEYSGIELDADRLEVSLNGRNVPLTLKEVLLLRYLIRHRGEMLPRDRLLRDVWGYKYSGRSRTLDVHVCRLRRKLPPLAASLVTIGHFGYTLSDSGAGIGAAV